jgi:UDP-2,3-diacylglucosamine pyrophosphatase LpxH
MSPSWFQPTAPALPSAFARAAACGVLAALLEGTLRKARHDLPVYRRHLGILGATAVLGGLLELGLARWTGSPGPFRVWVAGLLASALALALTSLPWLRGRRLGGAAWWRGTRRRPDPLRPLVLVADPHWGGELTGLEAATADHPEADWLFLGDVFDVWVGLRGMESPAQTAFLDWVDGRRTAGRWVGLWMGNREFFLDGLHGRFDLLGEGVGGGLDAEGLAWEHGDLVNDRDWRYRLFNLVSRSGPLWVLARCLPAGTLARLAARLERALRTTNRAYKLAFPRESFRRAAARHLGRTFATGHFHTLEREGLGISLPWAHDGRFMVWREGRVEDLRR